MFTTRFFGVVVVVLVFVVVYYADAQSQQENESFLTNNVHYLNNSEIGDLFEKLQHDYPHLAEKYSIGKTLQNREMYAIKLSAFDSGGHSLRPTVKLSANIEGDETVGRQIIIFLAQYLTLNYATIAEVQRLLNTTEIHLLPSCNPDGFASAKEGVCESLQNYVGRSNAYGVDLNRDFPDRLESEKVIQLRSQSRQPETAALIDWILSKPFVLSANFHGGAVVASYPYDNSKEHHEALVESLAPDDRVFKLMAHTYADNHPVMRQGNNCGENFTDGVTNGAKWYELNGGMQDFNYAFSNCFELTIELSCCKFPPASTLPAEWANNKRSLLELLKLAHIGVKGVVKDAGGYPINSATIVVSGLEDKPIITNARGEYWRLLTPGIYNVQAAAFGYQASDPQQIHVTNENSEALRLDFTLLPVATNYDGNFRKVKVVREQPESKDLVGGFLTPTKFEHHNYTAMEKYLRNIADSYPFITRLYSIGKSVENRDLWVMEIFVKPGEHVPGIPEFKYVANMHGNEVVGREMLLLLTKYLCEHYLLDERITTMINTTRMHFLYSMNPDGYEISKEGDRSSGVGRANANGIDLNRNFPDQYGTDKFNRVTEPEVLAVMNWTLSLPFVLSANLHGGSLVANYPFDDNENDFTDPLTRLRLATVKNRKLNPTDDNELFQHLATVYATLHPTMHLGQTCPLFKNEVFPHGITNGAQWYSVTGGMQDWNYVRAGVLEITLELGCDKFPMAAELPKYWEDNREPLLTYIEQVHYGVHGFVKSSISTPLSGAMITLDGAKHATYSSKYGDYFKLALPGRHSITVLADGYTPQRQDIEIGADGKRSMRFDVTLMRDDPQHWASANDYRILENVVHTRYHTNSDLKQQMEKMTTSNGQIATFGYADSEFGFYYNPIKLTSDIGEPEESKFKILILSSFFDAVNPLGREITVNLMRHIIEGYKLREPPIMNLLKRTIFYFMPLTDNFDQIFDMYNKNEYVCDPMIGNELADRILSPESEKKRDLLLQFIDTERFDLMLTFSSGSSDLSYPKGRPILDKFARYVETTEFSFPPLQCPGTSTRTLQHDATERLTNLFYKLYNVPMFTLGLSCCRMPQQTDIASIWRKNLEKLKNFIHLTDTGIVGHVQNDKGEPLRNAFIRLDDHDSVYNVTKNTARFQIILPEGRYSLELSAPHYEPHVQSVVVTRDAILDMGTIKLSSFTLITGKSEVHPMGTFGGTTAAVTSSGGSATVSGFVLDVSNHPLKNAKVSVLIPPKHESLRGFTDSLGAYSIDNVPAGDVTLKVEAPRHQETTRLIHVGTTGAPIAGVVFRLKIDENVLGMPRIFFIIVTSIVMIIGVVICILFTQFLIARRQRIDKRYYSFSLLPQKTKELFEDDAGDDGETELFRSPIKKGMSIQPYFDEENVEARILHSDDSEYNDDSGDEIVMLEKRTP